MTKKEYVNMNHTVLAKSSGNGVVEWVFAHPDVSRYDNLKAVPLASYTEGDLIEIDIEVLPTGVRKVRDSKFVRISPAEWFANNEGKLQDEMKQWEGENGITPVVAPEPEPEPELVVEKPARKTGKNIYIAPRDMRLYNTMRTIASATGMSKMLFVGPSGYGKSSIPQFLAESWGMSFLRWDCATVRDPEEFFGFRGARDGSTQDDAGNNLFSPSLFTQRLQEGNAIILLDELSRLDPTLANVLFPILDDAQTINVAGHQINIGENVIIAASINVGYQYTGTFTLDEALRNRFDVTVEVGPLPHEKEVDVLTERYEITDDIANRIVRLMSSLRVFNEMGKIEADASTRVSLAISKLLSHGLSPADAIFYTVISGIEESQRTEVINAAGIEFEISFVE